MARTQLKLHAAIAAVLVNAADRRGARVWLTLDETRRAIEALDLYRRGSDGAYPPNHQIAARIRQYPDLFESRREPNRQIRLRL